MPTATPVPVHAVNATSGNSAADAGDAHTTVGNTQLGAAVAGGGDGNVAVNNQHTGAITDLSSASSQTGNAVALAPTVGPGTPVPTGVTTSSSGHASATGLNANTTVDNTSAGAIQIQGQNHANANLTQRSNIDITNESSSAAESGAAWSVAAGAGAGVSGVATPRPGSGTPTTASSSVTGLQTQTTSTNVALATMTVPGGKSTPAPISITSDQTVNIKDGASAKAVSADASGTPAAGAGANAATGSAAAQGLQAQNSVNTNANVSVKVGGQNFAPIQVVIDSVTTVLNWGLAAAGSGDATAGSGGGASPTAASTASSGTAQATGAQIQNTVDLRAGAAVHVEGDNYDPINIVLNLTANLFNWGIGSARSGDAAATGASGAGTATTGAASATGLQVVNLVNMWADAAVDIDGNNYAPIFIRISFKTNIENYGAASAMSGNAAAGQANTAGGGGSGGGGGPSGSNGGGSSTSGGVVGDASRARGGDVVAIANSVDAAVSSTQMASANGTGTLSSSHVNQLMRGLSNANANSSPFVQRPLPEANTPKVESGLASTSGDSVALGMRSSIVHDNVQLGACAVAGNECFVSNRDFVDITVGDLSDNPAKEVLDELKGRDPNENPSKGTVAGGGCACVQVTPTPTPRPRSSGNGGGDGEGNGSSRVRASGRTQLTVASGHTVFVDLWGNLPGRRLPPMPNPLGRGVFEQSVTAELGGWPGANELPLPQLGTDDPQPPRRGLSRTPGRLPDSSADDDLDMPLLALVDVDLWTSWPGVQSLPVPPQAASVQVAAVQAPAEEVEAPVDAGVTGVDFGLPALLSLLLGALGGSRRGRLLLGGMGANLVQFVAGLPQGLSNIASALMHPRPLLGVLGALGLAAAGLLRAIPRPHLHMPGRRTRIWITRHATRGLAILRLALSLVRLTIGLFRLWHW